MKPKSRSIGLTGNQSENFEVLTYLFNIQIFVPSLTMNSAQTNKDRQLGNSCWETLTCTWITYKARKLLTLPLITQELC